MRRKWAAKSFKKTRRTLRLNSIFAYHFSGCSVARSSRLLWEQEVAGSNPATPTKNGPRDVAQPGSAHAWGAWGRRFKSCHPD